MPPWLVVGGAAAVLVGVGGYLVTRPDRAPISLEQIRSVVRSGDFEAARRSLDRLRVWADGDAERTARIRREADELAAVSRSFDELRATIVREATTATYAAQIEALKAIEAGPDAAAAIAARLVRGQLSALRREAEAAAVVDVAQAPSPVPPQPATELPMPEPVVDELPVTEPLAETEPVAPALAVVAVAAAPAAPEPVLVAVGDEDPAAGERRARRAATLAVLADVPARVEADEVAGNFEGAVARLVEAAARVRDSDPLYAAGLDGRAADLRHLQTFVAAVAERLAEQEVAVELATGGAATLVGIEAGQPRLRWENGEGRRDWRELRPSAWPGLLASLRLPAPAWLGAAVLAYRAADADAAERCLRQALLDAPALAADVDGIVQRGRGETEDRGYAVVDGRFVARRFVDARQLAAQLQQDLARALRRGRAETEALLSIVLAPGPESLDAVVLALREQLLASAARLEAHPFRQQQAALAAQRARLDAARARALELIFDQERYFYPHREPAVSKERAADYVTVRDEVRARIEAVRALWQDRSVGVEIPEDFRSEIAVATLAGALLARLNEHDAELDARLAWLRRLPAGRRLTLRDGDLPEAEASEHRLRDRILAFNELACAGWSDQERELAERINADRLMLGLRPLAANDGLQRAARTHAREMEELGYMGHLSTTPGRRTPADRMRQEGYLPGAAENCATGDSAAEVYATWCGSSAHHRHLLDGLHTEFGVGAVGRHWAVDFGSGAEYRANPAFPGPR